MKPVPSVRHATFTDFPVINSYDEFLGDRRLDMQRKELIVCDFGESKAIGFGKLTNHYFFDWPMLSILCVKSEYRRNGVARALIQHAILMCRGSRLYTSTEVDNDMMNAVMENMKFKQVGYIDSLNFDDRRELVFRLL